MTQTKNNIDKKRSAKNTLMLYFRQIFIMAIQLYTVRAILNILGVEDYGIFSVVAGFVMLLSFLTSTMSSATQRFFSFALGKNDFQYLRSVFGTNVVVYGTIALVAVLLLESVGLWFVHCRLNIPAGRMAAAQLLYQFVVGRFIFVLFASPCIAIIIAHEDMNIFAVISALEALLSLIIVIILPFCSVDKLAMYGFMLFLSAICITLLYCIVCFRKYKECSFRNIGVDRQLLKEIIDFTGWTLFGCVSTVFRSQAVTILLNQFFNPTIVAARTIALSVSGAINTFSGNFNTGLYPPIIKAWSTGDREEMYKLVFWGSKIAFFLTWLFSLPCLLEMDFILLIWLKKVPPFAALFTRLILVESIILSISLPIATAARAPGKMLSYELPLGIIQILIFPVSWLILWLGGEAYTTLVAAIFANIVMFFVRLHIVRNLTGLPLKPFMVQVLKPVLITSAVSFGLSYGMQKALPAFFLKPFVVMFLCGIFTVVCIGVFGVNSAERNAVISMLKNKLRR